MAEENEKREPTAEEVDEIEKMLQLTTELAVNFLKFSLWPLERQMKYYVEFNEVREIMKAVFIREQTYRQTLEHGN